VVTLFDDAIRNFIRLRTGVKLGCNKIGQHKRWQGCCTCALWVHSPLPLRGRGEIGGMGEKQRFFEILKLTLQQS